MAAKLLSTVGKARALIPALLLASGQIVSATAQIQEQWKPVDKSLADYISDGFAIQTILLDRVTPVAVQATLYYLRKDAVLVRCGEVTTRRGATTTALTVSCAELVKPETK